MRQPSHRRHGHRRHRHRRAATQTRNRSPACHGGKGMSLTVSPNLIEQAHRGEIDDAAFTSCIATSLPYAWQVITGLIGELHASGTDLADNQVPPPDEAARGQLLRVMASDAMRGAIERHYGVRLAFPKCHRVAVVRLEAAQARA